MMPISPRARPATVSLLCGPPPMMDAVVAALTAAGVPADQIHLERFSTAI